MTGCCKHRMDKIFMRLKIFTATALLALVTNPSAAYAQADFEAWKKQQESAFEAFRSEQDRAFLDFLKQQWERTDAATEPLREAQPKPDRIPLFDRDIELPTDVIEIDEPPAEVTPPVAEPPPPDDAPEAVVRSGKRLNFFGVEVFVPDTHRFPPPLRGVIDPDKIAGYWSAASEAPYGKMLQQLQTYRRQMRLNDWGYARLLHEAGKKIYPTSPDTRRLFVWFMLSKSGYMARVGYKDSEVVLLLPMHQVLYGSSYFTVEGVQGKFYAVAFEPSDRTTASSIYTYKGGYPGATRRLDMRLAQMPALGDDALPKTLTFTHRGKKHTASVHINRFIAAFFTDYPQTAFDVYFAAPMSDGPRRELVSALKKMTQGLSEQESVNLILHFVQTAFAYQTDEDQFKREKPLFPDETLYYPASDCEDRAVLFAYLVRQILDLDVLGLDYPGHIATAVRFIGQAPGMRVQYGGSTYVVCDPTYIHADIGLPIPQVRKAVPKVIRVAG